MVIIQQNWSEVVGMIRFAKQMGVQAVNFIPPVLHQRMQSLGVDKENLSRLREKLGEAGRVAEQTGIETNAKDLLNEFSYFTGGLMKSKSVQSQSPCYAGWIFSYILEDGTVVSCCENYVSPWAT
jgi:hypothetical protein